MGQIIPFVTVKHAKEAFSLYQEVFHAEQQGDITWLNNVPGFEAEQYNDMIGHLSVKLGDSVFFMNDYLEDHPVSLGDNIQFVYNFDTEEELRTAFTKLAGIGTIIEDLQEVFWGALFGSVKDPYGVTWQIYYGHK